MQTRAKSIIKMKTKDGNNIDLEIPEGATSTAVIDQFLLVFGDYSDNSLAKILANAISKFYDS